MRNPAILSLMSLFLPFAVAVAAAFLRRNSRLATIPLPAPSVRPVQGTQLRHGPG
jgi:hypothetical protein